MSSSTSKHKVESLLSLHSSSQKERKYEYSVDYIQPQFILPVEVLTGDIEVEYCLNFPKFDIFFDPFELSHSHLFSQFSLNEVQMQKKRRAKKTNCSPGGY